MIDVEHGADDFLVIADSVDIVEIQLAQTVVRDPP